MTASHHQFRTVFCYVPLLCCLSSLGAVQAEDWTMGGKTPSRNPVSLEKSPPLDWDTGEREIRRKGVSEKISAARNMRWSVFTGTVSSGGPLIAGGLVWIGTNNNRPFDPAITGDRGVLACFRESDGKFLYQYTAERLPKYTQDWPTSGLSTTPVAEGDKLWFITNRREIVCLDVGPLRAGTGQPKVLWKYDLVAEHGIYPDSPMLHSPNSTGDLAIHRNLLFVPTGNGVGVDHPGATKIRKPAAPALLCLNKETGEYLWEDHSAGAEGYGGHRSSPLVVQLGDQAQVIHPQADGWVRSYRAETGELLWKFDLSRKDALWHWFDDESSRQIVVATPVFAEGRVYFATGRELEFASGPGRLFCIDPSKTGDISPELETAPGKSKPNPNSGLIWKYTEAPEATSADASERKMHQTISSVAVHRGLVIAPDCSGLVHCLDAATGKHHWTHIGQQAIYANPLIVDDKVYIANNGGEIEILELATPYKLVATNDTFDKCIESSPAFANGTLFVLTRGSLHAIGGKTK